MSDIPVVVTPPQESAESRSPGYPLADRVQRAGYLLLGLQLAGFLAWSAFLYSRFSVTSDFSTYNQPLTLIAHGDLDPYSTLGGLQFWRNDSELTPWLLAPLYLIVRTGLLLSWAQALSVAGAEVVAFGWLSELARRGATDRAAAWLTGFGLVLLVANPWVWWTVSFDVHQEALVIFFVVLLARDVWRGRRRSWLWALAVVAGGAPATSYIVGIGLGGVLAGRRSRKLGALLALAALAYLLFVVLVHGDDGVPLAGTYGYLASGNGVVPAQIGLGAVVKGIALHPLNVLRALWAKRVDMAANLAPGGLLGIGVPLLAPLMVIVLLANSLIPSFQFSEPLFQSIPIYLLLPVGTVTALAWLRGRRPRTALVLACLLAAQAVGWAVVWGPKTSPQWLRVPASTAATLASVQAQIPSDAEVAVSQGVSGRFSGRAYVYPLFGKGVLPLHTLFPLRGDSWFVVTPEAGIELQSTASAFATIGDLAALHATLVTHANGVWAFRLTPPRGMRSFTVPSDAASPLPAWAADGVAGLPVLTGPVPGWHMAATGAKGYVSDGLEWLKTPGRYVATVKLSAFVPVNVEVWDDTTNTLLARRTIRAPRTEQVTVPVTAPAARSATVYSGWGPFSAYFTPPPPGQRLEVRVWSPGGAAVNVYSAALTAASAPARAVRTARAARAAGSSAAVPAGAGS